MAQPRGSLPHDDHFHIRISCPAAMEGCIELPMSKSDRYARAFGAGHGRMRGGTSRPLPALSSSSTSPSPSPSNGRARPTSANPVPKTPRNVRADDATDLPVFPTPPPESEVTPQLAPA